MKILFLCGCLEPARDGVGDYTRLLANQCQKQGHICAIISINDTQLKDEESFHTQVKTPTIFRFRNLLNSSNQKKHFLNFLNEFNPDWISLQFVPFSFHPKGICKNLATFIKQIKGSHKWHVMFHEIWIGAHIGASIKEKSLGYIQKKYIKKIIRQIHPKVLHTHAKAYQFLLKQSGIQTDILPLFSNLPQNKTAEDPPIIQEIKSKINPLHKSSSKIWFIGIFGIVHPEWNESEIFKAIQEQALQNNIMPVILFFGKNTQKNKTQRILEKYSPTEISIYNLGELESKKISALMQPLDFAISTTPISLYEKSGSTIASLEHGIPVVFTRNEIHFKGFQLCDTNPFIHLFDSRNPINFANLKRHNPYTNLPKVTEAFIKSLEN